MAKTLTITRDKVVGMLKQLGVPKADKLSDEKLIGKLGTLDDTDDTIDPGKFRKTFEKIVAANKKGTEIEIDSDGAAPAKEEKAAKGKKTAAPAKKASAKGKGKKGSDDEDEKPAKKKRSAEVEKDAYGRRIGTGAAKMNALLVKAGKKGLSLDTLTTKSGMNRSFASSHMRTMISQGHVKLKDGVYTIKA